MVFFQINVLATACVTRGSTGPVDVLVAPIRTRVLDAIPLACLGYLLVYVAAMGIGTLWLSVVNAATAFLGHSAQSRVL